MLGVYDRFMKKGWW